MKISLTLSVTDAVVRREWLHQRGGEEGFSSEQAFVCLKELQGW